MAAKKPTAAERKKVKKKPGPKPKVDTHPKKTQIVNALVRGEGIRMISDRFGISQTSLKRYLKDHLIPRAANEQAKRSLRDGDFILDELDEIMTEIKNYIKSSADYLRDPEDPEKFFIGPRAEDIEVVYYKKPPKGAEMWKTVKTKSTIQKLLYKIEGEDYNITDWKFLNADPRKLYLEGYNTLIKYLSLLAKIKGEIKDVKININMIEEWPLIVAMLLKSTAGFPQVKEKIVAGLHSIADKTD